MLHKAHGNLWTPLWLQHRQAHDGYWSPTTVSHSHPVTTQCQLLLMLIYINECCNSMIVSSVNRSQPPDGMPNVLRKPPGQMSMINHAYEEVMSYACQQCVHGPHIILLRGNSSSLCTAPQVLVNQHCLMFAQMLLLHLVPAIYVMT